MRILLRLLLLAITALLIVIISAACRILGYQIAPSIYPPPPDAVPSGLAESVTTRIAAQPDVDREDLAVSLAPSTTASVQLYVDGQNFYPAILNDIRAARSSVHFEEYGFTPGQVADMYVPVLTSKAQQGVEVRMIVDRFGSHVDTDSREMFNTMSSGGDQVAVNYPFLFSWVGLWGTNQSVDWRFQQVGHF